jgi:hypothetical protein
MTRNPKRDVTARAVKEPPVSKFDRIAAALRGTDDEKPPTLEIMLAKGGQELGSLGAKLRAQRNVLIERRARVQHVVNAIDGQIGIIDRALHQIESN